MENMKDNNLQRLRNLVDAEFENMQYMTIHEFTDYAMGMIPNLTQEEVESVWEAYFD